MENHFEMNYIMVMHNIISLVQILFQFISSKLSAILPLPNNCPAAHRSHKYIVLYIPFSIYELFFISLNVNILHIHMYMCV